MSYFVERCEAANEVYLQILQEFCKEMIVIDREREKNEEIQELSGVIILKKIFSKDIKEEAREFLALEQPESYLFPKSLDAIYGSLKTILSKRGWYETIM